MEISQMTLERVFGSSSAFCLHSMFTYAFLPLYILQ